MNFTRLLTNDNQTFYWQIFPIILLSSLSPDFSGFLQHAWWIAQHIVLYLFYVVQTLLIY